MTWVQTSGKNYEPSSVSMLGFIDMISCLLLPENNQTAEVKYKKCIWKTVFSQCSVAQRVTVAYLAHWEKSLPTAYCRWRAKRAESTCGRRCHPSPSVFLCVDQLARCHRHPPALPTPALQQSLSDRSNYVFYWPVALEVGRHFIVSWAKRGKMAIVLLVEKMMASILAVNKWCVRNRFQLPEHPPTHRPKVVNCPLVSRGGKKRRKIEVSKHTISCTNWFKSLNTTELK